jgi:tetratricopeptide (TPR) repeat protein
MTTSRWALLALLLAWGGCGRAPPPEVSPDWAREVAEAHARADALMKPGRPPVALDEARRTLEAIVAGAQVDGAGGDTRRVLLQDTYFRLAQLELSAGENQAATARADQGLALGGGDDLFVANLLVVRAAAREALGQTRPAAADYERALRINDALLSHTLEGR